MLTAAQIAEYHEKGYVVPGYRLGADTLAAIRRDHDRLLVDIPSSGTIVPPCSPMTWRF